jgi:hypothetical protein
MPARPEGWELIECPECGAECYVTPEARDLVAANPQLKAVCTVCALRLGSRDSANRAKEYARNYAKDGGQRDS